MLLTSGCSFVWGDELEGYDNDPPTHWNHTFTHKLAEKLGVDYVNLGKCGSGNEMIFREVSDYLKTCEKLPTHMVILWSAWQRSEVAENHPHNFDPDHTILRYRNMTQVCPTRTHNAKQTLGYFLELYYDLYDSARTGIIHGLTYMTHMQWLCEMLGIKLIQGVFHRRNWEAICVTMHPSEASPEIGWSSWMDYVQEQLSYLKDTSRLGMNRYKDMYSLGEKLKDIREYGHPGEKTHTEYAKLLYKIFRSEFE